jgi:hypothetical protein
MPDSTATESKRSQEISTRLMWGLLFVVVLGVVAYVGYRIQKPVPMRSVRLSVEGEPGMAFLGKIVVDGREEEVRGVAPQSFDRRGRNISFVLIRTDLSSKTYISVVVDETRYASAYGTKGSYGRSNGFSAPRFSMSQVTDAEWRSFPRRIANEADSPLEKDVLRP